MFYRRYVTTFLLSILTLGTLQAQTGSWSGSISVQGMKINMVFHLSDDAPLLDVPTQGAKGIPAQLTRQQDGSITFAIPTIRASFSGRLKGDTLEGEFTQHGMHFPMKLIQGQSELKRPQTPQAPFPYTTEEVTFHNGEATLSGTLTLPQNHDKHTPAVILVSGSGLQDRNSTLFGHQPFLVIADALARQGIATLRYDDRGFAPSKGEVVKVTNLDFKNDALAGIELLHKWFKRVGIIGHSEGGTIALMLAAEGKADFIISLAGAVVSGKDILLEQNRTALQQAGISTAQADAYCQALNRGWNALAEGKPMDEVPPSDLQDAALDANYQAAIKQSATPYLRYFLKLDGRNYLAKIKCPVLALNGKLDQQVLWKPNLEAMEKGLVHAPHRVEAKDSLNHLFQHAHTGAVSEYGEIEETFSPDVIDEMISWIKEVH